MLSDFTFKKKKNTVQVEILIEILGFRPKNIKFLKEVFIFSFSEKKTDLNQNYSFNFQRLEFLGDSILNSIVSHFLYKKFPNKKEGDLTQIRSKIVCRRNLNKISRKLTISDIFLKKTIISENILGNILESLIGFIYLEIGYEACKDFVYKKILQTYINIEKIQNEIFSYKVWIIEWVQKNKFVINFETYKEKEDKNKNTITYLSKISISKYKIETEGRGFSKKKSEEMAAKVAYFIIQKKIKKNT